MNEVIIGLSSAEKLSQRFLSAWNSGEKLTPFIGFESEEQLWKTLTLARWQVLKAMTGIGDVSVCELALKINRDVETVQADVEVLLNCGLLERSASEKVVFPYDAVHVDFMLQAA